jgi:hypothetical protein
MTGEPRGVMSFFAAALLVFIGILIGAVATDALNEAIVRSCIVRSVRWRNFSRTAFRLDRGGAGGVRAGAGRGCHSHPGAAARAGFSVCATEKLTDAADFLDDVREAAMRVISSGAIAKAKIQMAKGQS